MGNIPKPKIIIDITAVGLLVAGLHARAIDGAWYWVYPWVDIPMHFLGGLFVGLVALWAIGQVQGSIFGAQKTVRMVLFVVFMVSVGWEAFEYATGVFLVEEFLPDTLYDLAFDMFGGVAALAGRSIAANVH